jgi:uncharacterized protein (TIGR02452 family)
MPQTFSQDPSSTSKSRPQCSHALYDSTSNPLISAQTHATTTTSMPPDHRYRDDLRQMAEDTLRIIERNGYKVKNTAYRLRTEDLQRNTQGYGPQALDDWQPPPPSHQSSTRKRTYINIVEVSTLACARQLSRTLKITGASNQKVGVLNFASATKPGGGFKNGAQAQEESIARVSNLYPSLVTRQARAFYDIHTPEGRDPMYTHSMIYSPGVEVFKDDKGALTKPMPIDVLTCAAVNAHQVRQAKWAQKLGRVAVENQIESVMRDRMGRILYLFEMKGVRNVVLGSFGTGVFRNDVNLVARLWAELLTLPGARFAGSFDRVFFAILGRKTFVDFGNAFNHPRRPPPPSPYPNTSSQPNPPGSYSDAPRHRT